MALRQGTVSRLLKDRRRYLVNLNPMRQRLILAQTYNGHSNNPTDIRAAPCSGDFQEMELLSPGAPPVNLAHEHPPT